MKSSSRPTSRAKGISHADRRESALSQSEARMMGMRDAVQRFDMIQSFFSHCLGWGKWLVVGPVVLLSAQRYEYGGQWSVVLICRVKTWPTKAEEVRRHQ